MWWMLMGALLLSFVAVLAFIEEHLPRCAWCGDKIPEGHQTPYRRPYGFDNLEIFYNGVYLYCSRHCEAAHAFETPGNNRE